LIYNVNNLEEFFRRLKRRNICLVGIDSLLEHRNIFDLLWIPSFNFDCGKFEECSSLLKSGWDSFLIQKLLPHKAWVGGSRVLVLTGSGDVSGLGKILPAELDKFLGEEVEVHWVRGPFSSAPYLPKTCRLTWVVHDAPKRLDELIVQSDYVLTVFGVSFFEVLQYGIPTVVFSPYSHKDNDDLLALSKEGVAMVAGNFKGPVNSLVELMNNDELSKTYSINALNKMSTNGAESLSKEIYTLVTSK
jgi:UDP-N-acetylglucosamine:LPS N-acetylglucosamine transferase